MIAVTHGTGFAREVADTVVFVAGERVAETGPPTEVPDAPREERTRAFPSEAL
ncbi:amino acid ABC transporter ATP-binding protein [Streptomyces sp. NPDC007157]|uniref:amino acid ABC transporter ATP-binding protein n=1 Tax=Streptomyces sp. NPDC007157 TaxID=3154681 RepID=UPI0034059AA9